VAPQPIPVSLPENDKLFLVTRMVPQGQVSQVEYVVYVNPEAYSQMAGPVRRHQVARIVGRLNKVLEKRNFILIGPGRWGSANVNLGVPVGYADICNARALVELAVPQQGIIPEPSYGTHFFQDLAASHIYPLAIYHGQDGDWINEALLNQAQNQLPALLPEDAEYDNCIKVIHIPTEREGYYLELGMDGKQALAYLRDSAQDETEEAGQPPQADVSEKTRLSDAGLPDNPFYGW